MLFARYALITIALVFSALAQNAGDPEFAAPAPRTCASHNSPQSGAPTSAQAKQYVACDLESYIRNFSQRAASLVSNLNVEVGKGRPFNIRTDSWPDVDPTQTIYPIRGSFTQWLCYAPRPDVGPDNFPVPTRGKNCTKAEAPTATGQCYKDSFGDWHCKFCCPGQVITETKWMVSYFPPPPANR